MSFNLLNTYLQFTVSNSQCLTHIYASASITHPFYPIRINSKLKLGKQLQHRLPTTHDRTKFLPQSLYPNSTHYQILYLTNLNISFHHSITISKFIKLHKYRNQRFYFGYPFFSHFPCFRLSSHHQGFITNPYIHLP